MPKFLVRASYTAKGAKGLLHQGGTRRREIGERAVTALGGTMESFYFALAKDDVYIVVDLPSSVAAAALNLATIASGGVKSEIVALLTPEEIDEASRMTTQWEPPEAPPEGEAEVEAMAEERLSMTTEPGVEGAEGAEGAEVAEGG
ncbi:MAG TPA: GYD domain-containing protein [Mycobacteriales bacterium]|jgi:GYD domain.